jgi:hypothetical protein
MHLQQVRAVRLSGLGHTGVGVLAEERAEDGAREGAPGAQEGPSFVRDHVLRAPMNRFDDLLRATGGAVNRPIPGL